MTDSGDDPGLAGRDPRRAWSVALGAALAAGVAFGTLFTFGAFFGAMAADLDAGRGATALVFGITLLMFYGFGVVSGPIADRIGPRPLVLTGAISMAVGLFATARVESVTAGYVTYGLGVGIGGGLIITPVYAAIGGWFVHRRVLAMGIAGTGIGLGTLILAPLAGRLVENQGWRDAYTTLSVIVGVSLLLAAVVIARPPSPSLPPPPALGAMRALLAIREFQVVFASSLLYAVAVFAPFALVVDLATEDGVDPTRAALLTGLIGASSVVGRLGIAPFASRYSSVRLLQACLVLQPVSFLIWLVAGGQYALLVVFVVVLGVSYGGYSSLFPAVAIHLFGAVGVGATMGLMFLGAGFGGLLGPPVIGLIVDGGGPSLAIVVVLAVSTVSFGVSLAIPLQPPGVIATVSSG